MNQTENFSDLQPYIEISNSAIINAVRSESYRDTRWKVWLKAAQHYWGADGEGKEILEVLHLGSQVIGLMQLGICFSFDLYSRKVRIINKNAKEKVRSIFINSSNQSLFVVSVKLSMQTPSRATCMYCRSIPIAELSKGITTGERVFRTFTLKYPDFIEFDDLNKKIVTMHSDECSLRVWDIQNYSLLYVLSHEDLTEFKICNGVIMLILEKQGSKLPMRIHNVHTGALLHSVNYENELLSEDQPTSSIRFIEQFNEYLLIQLRDSECLQVLNLVTQQTTEIKDFKIPHAFIFVYEKYLMLGLKDGLMTLHNVRTGEMISDFKQEISYTLNLGHQQRYVATLSDSRKLLFTLVEESNIVHQQYDQMVGMTIEQFAAMRNGQKRSSYINVIDILNGEVAGRIHCHGKMEVTGQQLTRQKSPLEMQIGAKKFDRLMKHIFCVHYGGEKNCHQLVTGHQNGSVVIWK